MAAILGDRVGRMAIPSQIMRGILDSIATRLDEARDISRYMTGLLVFLGLLGTFWGLIETVGSVGGVIGKLKSAAMPVGVRFAEGGPRGAAQPAWASRSRPRCSAWPARSCSASSTCRWARRRTASTPSSRTGSRPPWAISASSRAARRGGAAPAGAEIKVAIDRLKDAIAETGSSKAATAAMANLAEAIQGLVKHMRTEQQMIRDWVDAQAEQQREIKRLLERIAREDVREGCAKTVRSMALARSRRERGMNYWPGFVDALSTLLLAIIFLLSVFVVVQFYLSQEVTGKDTALTRLNAQIAQLTELLSMEKTGKASLEETIAHVAGEPGRRRERARPPARACMKGSSSGAGTAQGQITALDSQLEPRSA